MKKVFALLFALCTISAVLAGCSGGDTAAETTTGTTETPKKEGE